MPRSLKGALPVPLALLLVLSACGTRVSESNRGGEAAARAVTPSSAPEASVDARAGKPPVDSSPIAAPSTAAGDQTGSATSRAAPGRSPGSTAAGGTKTTPTQPAAPSPSPGRGSAPGVTPQQPGPAPAPIPTPAPGTGSGSQGRRSVVVLASIGTYSGPVGSALGPIAIGGQLWSKFINDRGGVNGHPLKLIVYDDGGDPSRHRSQVQDAVERQGALALVANGSGLTGEGSVDYITQKRIPVVGLDGGAPYANRSPMYFPQAANSDSLLRTWVPSTVEQVSASGKKKFGTLVCVEGAICDQADKVLAEDAPAFGLEHVYRGRASVAQPDFTAECLAARNRGVEVLFMVLDANSAGRVGSACTRQGFKPTFALLGQGVSAQAEKDSNLAGTVASSSVFPYFSSGTPATEQFQAALKAYGKGVTPGISLALGWTAGKLFERAAANLPEPPTREALLQGLWSLKSDTLDGLTGPLTFTQDKPAEPRPCWFALTLKDNQWASPDNGALHCRK